VRLDLVMVGFGNVGRRFVRLLGELAPALARDYGIETRVTAVTTRTRGQVFNPNGIDAVALASSVEAGGRLGTTSTNPGAGAPRSRTFLRETIRRSAAAARQGRLVIVEATTLDVESGQPAIAHVRAALAGGAHVVSANKGPAAFAYRALAAAARRANRCFLFESAVLDGIPLFNLTRATLPAVAITGFEGVVNSTTNYILTKMEEGQTFDSALADMQRAGIAEADASLDVDGWDAAAKTAILANVLLGARLTPQTVQREGISAAAAERLRAARAAGKRLKLVASAARDGKGVRARVRLVELPETDLLAQLDGQQNAVVLHTDLVGEIAVVQRGSGLTHTAYGLVSDLVAIGREVKTAHATPQRRRRGLRDRTPSTRGRR
jgi:homoserine dehydrogenase